MDEAEVEKAILRFYGAIETMIGGKGAGPMHDCWHHLPTVSTSHPTGEWSHGWDEVAATWDVIASFGKEGVAGTQTHDVKVHVVGELAYTTLAFVSAPAWGSVNLNCTNVLQRIGGVWKVIHHHADRAPAIEIAMENLVA